jgi:hypothetical protein
VGDRKNSMLENARKRRPIPAAHCTLCWTYWRGWGRRGERPLDRGDGHSTMGLVGAFFGTCRPTKQARSPSVSGHKPVSGMASNNNNNILTNDKSCGTVSQLMRACLRITSDCDDDRASGASAEWTRCKPFLRSHRPVARSPYSADGSD